jgi:hypothetical protein
MFLRAVVYSKVTEVKLVLYDSDPNNARMKMKNNTFRSMNPMYGRERIFSRSTRNYMHNFLSNVNANNQLLNDYSLCLSFSTLQQSLKFDFQCFVNDKNNLMKEKLGVHFSKRIFTILMRDRKSNHKESNNNNPINSFNESKK